ncbi:MAG: ankyrin repeat domain-containing protein [Betaproteobacteria bacterium]|nr:ankyrin repeat domain-containing protein [Betaproteobacteria bacterium]
MAAEFHTYAHDYDQADLAYRRQIELSSVAPWPMGNYSRFLRVRRLDTAGSERYARQALAIMEYGMARDSLAAALYLQWAELRASGKNPERANALFAEASRLNPDLSELVNEIGYYPRAHPILDALVAKGISLDTLPGVAGGTTPLSIAAHNRSPALAAQMMTLGANPNTAGYAGMTPLMLAAQRGDETMVRLLLNRGADPTLVASDGRDAERRATELNQFPIANLLAAAKRAYVRPAGGLTPSVPFRTQTIYRVKKNFTNEQSSAFKQGEEIVFDTPTPFGDEKSARFVFKRADGGVREFIVEKDKISSWAEYFEEIGPAPAPLR